MKSGSGIAFRCAALAVAVFLAACGGGGGGIGFGETPTGPVVSPLSGNFGSGDAVVSIDGAGNLVGGVSRSDANSSTTIGFSGVVSYQGDGTWVIPFALIGTTHTVTGSEPVKTSMRGQIAGSYAPRSAIAFGLPPAAVPAGMNRTYALAHNGTEPVALSEVTGRYVEQGGTPVHPVPIRDFEVFTSGRIVGTYIPFCTFDGTIHIADPTSNVITADALFQGATCPDGYGYNRRLIGYFSPASGGSPATLRLAFTDNGGYLHTLFGLRGS